jgi:hypothetical protein
MHHQSAAENAEILCMTADLGAADAWNAQLHDNGVYSPKT